MKKKIYSVVAVLSMLMALMTFLPIKAFADGDITVNGISVNKGDIVTYEYYVGEVEGLVAGAGCVIKYDTTCLEYVEGSIGFDVFNNAMHNIMADKGMIYFSAVNAYGYDLSKERMVVTVSFKILDTAAGNITLKNEFDEFFTLENEDTDLTEEQYKDREVTTVNTYDQNNAPYLGTDADEMAEYMTSDSFELEDLFKGVPNENVPDSARSDVSLPSLPGEDEPEETASSGNTILIVIIVIFCVALIGAVVSVVVKGKKK